MSTMSRRSVLRFMILSAASLMSAVPACARSQDASPPPAATSASPKAASAWCVHLAGLSAATGKSATEGLPVLATVATQLAGDAEAARAQGYPDAAQGLEAAADQIQKAHDAIKSRGWTISLLVFPETDDSKDSYLFGHVSREVRTAVQKELLAEPGVQSATWSPNVFTVRFATFVTWNTLRDLGSLPRVASVAPDVGVVGLDPSQADQEDAQVRELQQLACHPDPSLNAADVPALS
jgi:hypothetical protein